MVICIDQTEFRSEIEDKSLGLIKQRRISDIAFNFFHHE